jgi:molecular chaperone DnaK
MVPICNRPVMEYVLELLKRHGVDTVIVTLHYLAEEVVSYFGDGSDFGLHIIYSVEDEPLGTAGSVKKVEEYLDDTFLVVSGDALTDFDLGRLLAFHRESSSMATVTLTRVESPLEYGVVITDQNHRIVRFLEKPSWGEVFSDQVNTGIYVLEPKILEMMEGILEVKASYGDAQLGGKDFDQALADLLERRFRLAHPQAQASERARAELRSVAESVKTQLSRHPAVQAFCPNYAVEAGRPLDLEFEVTRREFEEAIRPLLERARKCLQTTLEKAKVQARSVGRVLLVGGTTYVPAVRTLVAEIMGQEPRREVDPDLAVAQGAAIEAALIAGEIPSDQGLIKTDVTSFGLGVNVVGFVGLHMVNDLYDALIQPNTTLPYQVSKSYSLLHAQQKQVQLCLYQDHEGTAKRVVDAHATGLSAEIEDIPVSETGEPHPLEVDFSYDLNGLIQLRARIPTTGQEVALMTSRDGARSLDPAAFAQSKAKVDDLWSRSPLANRYEGLIRKAERMVPELRPEDRKKVHQATAALQEALASGDESRVEKAADRLTDLLFDLDGA